MIADYFQEVEKLLHSCPLTVSVDIQTEIIDINFGYFKAQVKFVGGPELHLFELVSNDKAERYRYHYQDSKGRLLKRWDNAKHHPEVKTFPHHLHVGDKVRESKKPEIADVLLEAINLTETK